MEDQLVDTEVAILAKQKGFDELCDWTQEGSVYYKSYKPLRNSDDKTQIALPTQSLLQRWLREKHRIVVLVYCYDDNRKDIFSYEIRKTGNFKKYEVPYFSYEEALEEGLLKGLNLINNGI